MARQSSRPFPAKTTQKKNHDYSIVKSSLNSEGRKVKSNNAVSHSKEFQTLFDLICKLQKETTIESLYVDSIRMGSLQENALWVHLQVA